MLCTTGDTRLRKHLSARYSAFALTAMQAFVGTLFFLPLALASASGRKNSVPTKACMAVRANAE
ncbi:hypothetical protein [Pseudomonas aeruginosa]|uniref:hypothetical protein n=1 Tax=Pseudomonas aeruginosa TaxID=287 RepID=UPI000877977D